VNVRQPARGASAAAAARNGVQPFNPIDRAMRCADRAIRDLGYPGLETQMFVWLDRRVAAASLRTAIARLSRQHPVVAARLVEPDGDEGPAWWQFRPGAVCPLPEVVLPSDNPAAVLEHAARLLSTPEDLAQADPLRFYLLHRPAAGDVLLLQYNHVLMDNWGTVPLLRQIDALAKAENDPAQQTDRRNPILRYLRQFSHQRRRAASLRAIHLQAQVLRGRTVTLRRAGTVAVGLPALHIAARTLPPAQWRALRSRIVAVCGFPSVSMAFLGSAFRAIDRLAPPENSPNSHFMAGIGLGLNLRAPRALTFQNLTSLVPIRVQRDDLGDRDQLLRTLSAQMRQRLAEEVDLGYLRLSTVFSRRPRHTYWVVQHLLHYSYSLWFAFFGSLEAVGSELCGARIENVTYTGPVWPSIGLNLLVSQYQERLTMQAAYDPRIVPPSLANEFLDFLQDDLAG
jgi:hypothetical protein